MKRRYRRITAKMLEKKGACSAQIEKFRELFGESVEVTVARAKKHADVFSFYTAADFFLHGKVHERFYKRANASCRRWDSGRITYEQYHRYLAGTFARFYNGNLR